MTDAAAPEIDTTPPPIWKRISVVWLVPLVALIVALAVTWQTLANQGPLITVSFENASGITAGQTPLRFRDVTIGTVEEVGFDDDLSQVLVAIRVEPEMAQHITEDAVMWIVRPEISAQGITGLSTVFGGTYIAAELPSETGDMVRRIRGQPRAPLTPLDQPGLRVRLLTNNSGSVSIGSPVLYKGIEVGRVEDLELTSDGRTIIFTTFINAPYDNLITEGTRFWNASGFSFSLDARGASLNVESLVTLVRGGVTFDTVFSDGALVRDERTFRLYRDPQSARASLFDAVRRSPVTVSAIFPGSVSGLTIGAPVSYRGVPVGEVTSLSTRLVGDPGEREVELAAAFSVEPGRLGLPPDAPASTTLNLLSELVSQSGLRAQLSAASILTGAQRIDLSEIPDEPPAELDLSNQPFPLMPSVAASGTGLAETAEGLITRIDELPVEAVLSSASRALDALAVLLSDPSLQNIPTEAEGALTDLRTLLASDGLTQAPDELLRGLTALRGLLEDAQEAALTEALAATLDETARAAAAVADGAQTLSPELVSALGSAEELIAAAQIVVADPQTAALPGVAASLLEDLRQVTADPALQGAPEQLGTSLARLDAILAEIEAAGLSSQLSQAFTDSSVAAREISVIAESSRTIPAELAALIAQTEALLASADAILTDPALQAAPGELNATLGAARALLEDPATRALPQATLDALARAGRLLGALEEADLPGTLARTMAETERATRAVAQFTEDAAPLPGQAEALLADPALREIPAQTQATLVAFRALLTDPATTALPGQLSEGLGSAQTLLAALEQAQVAEQLAATLQNASVAAEAIAEGAEGVPEIVAQLEALAEEASSLPLDALAAQVERVLLSAEALLQAPGARELPGTLNATLDEVRVLLEELREAGASESLVATLSASEQAALAIADTSSRLPTLIARLDALAGRADVTLAGYGEGSDLNDEAIRAIREFRDTARAITSLVRQIERDPNSLILGR
ncbi:MlaD family protein [Pontivivens ytuae]|uniref:MCE family protein n=1 Tax=Pontivivens ytuae TaxID=2789856 RepID=A0A7S9QBM6_9RHOB|nr:MlaD family protein [Pontivivens ytuae]QPH52221.1 MCE family protein [Pontivivens ytuae]